LSSLFHHIECIDSLLNVSRQCAGVGRCCMASDKAVESRLQSSKAIIE
jgi:hypothetical protein